MVSRNEKTGRFESTKETIPEPTPVVVNYEDAIAEAEAKLAALKKAQAEKVEAEKKAASEARKADASKVEEAYKTLNSAKKNYNEVVTVAKKAYMETLNDARKTYNESVKSADEVLQISEAAYNTALKEFTLAHPEGYHLTLKDGDNTTTISKNGSNDIFGFNDFFDFFFKRF